jgi:hypothetical protein
MLLEAAFLSAISVKSVVNNLVPAKGRAGRFVSWWLFLAKTVT